MPRARTAEASSRPIAAGKEAISPAALADMANEAFGGGFSAEYLDWLYTRAWNAGARTTTLREGAEATGHVAVLEMPAHGRSGSARIGQPVNCFAASGHRFFAPVRRLYASVENMLQNGGFAYAVTVPNEKSFLLNKRFLKLDDRLTLDIRVGVALPRTSRRVVVSRAVDRADAIPATRSIAGHLAPSKRTEVAWDAESLAGRLANPVQSYAIHATSDLALVSSPRIFRGIPVVLLCAFHARPGARIAQADIRALVAAAALFHRNPLYLYVGVNNALPRLPGWPIPERWRPSRMIVQVREMSPDVPRLEFDRFEALDFDFG